MGYHAELKNIVRINNEFQLLYSLSIESLSNMYCLEPVNKKQKLGTETQLTQYTENDLDIAIIEDDTITDARKEKSPILENKNRSFIKALRNGSFTMMKNLSKFPRTVLDDNVVESKFFSVSKDNGISSNNGTENETLTNSIIIEESPEKSKNPFKIKTPEQNVNIDSQCSEIPYSQESQKENSLCNSPVRSTKNPIVLKSPSKVANDVIKNLNKLINDQTNLNNNQSTLNHNQNSSRRESNSPILVPSPRSRNPFKILDQTSPMFDKCSEDSVIENTYPMETLVTPVDSQVLNIFYT